MRKITAAQKKKIEALAKDGCRVSHIAAELGIAQSTLYQKMRDDPTIKAAIERGRKNGAIPLLKKLKEQAKQGNTKAIFYLLDTVYGYKKVEIDPNDNTEAVLPLNLDFNVIKS